jgi:hypothetical protein
VESLLVTFWELSNRAEKRQRIKGDTSFGGLLRMRTGKSASVGADEFKMTTLRICSTDSNVWHSQKLHKL